MGGAELAKLDAEDHAILNNAIEEVKDGMIGAAEAYGLERVVPPPSMPTTSRPPRTSTFGRTKRFLTSTQFGCGQSCQDPGCKEKEATAVGMTACLVD